ncbi:MAG: dephospho-CoA kinase [Acholeplasmataceae bacterium]
MSAHTVKRRPLVIGLTGGIASGKSTVVDYLKERGYDVIDADRIVLDLYREDSSMQDEIRAVFGFTVRSRSDKKRLSKIIFRDPDKRRQLNAIIHPRVFARIEADLREHDGQGPIIIDMPLLIEVGYHAHCDVTILVYVSRSTQIERLMRRDHLSREEAERRIDTQMPLEEKKDYADYVLDNERSKKELYRQIDRVMKGITGS